MDEKLTAALETFDLELRSVLSPPLGTVEELNGAVDVAAGALADVVIEGEGIDTSEPYAAGARALLVEMLGLEILRSLRTLMQAAARAAAN